ncbi:MAG: hypothetical protein HYX55_06680 [Chloroflexi bacterium]|nr:hypothetical protein [Chloroflexota bacterium]
MALLLNDHVLKDAFPGFATGKLSDVAGVVFFPLLLAESAALLLRRDAARLLPAAAGLTALAFALVKLTPAGAASYAWGLGALQWIAALSLTGHGDLRQVVVVMDPTDLLAVPAVLAAVAVAGRPRPSASQSRVVSRLARSRLAPIGMGALMAAATMATSPAPLPPTGVVVSEPIRVASDEIAVRHLTWSVTKPESPFTRLRLEVSTRAGSDKNPDSTPSTNRYGSGPETDSFEPIRIVPDDPRFVSDLTRDGNEYEFTTAALDLTDSCRAGCIGGARIFVSATVALLVMRLTTGSARDDSLLSLKADGVGDYTGKMGLADSGAQVAQIELDHVRLTWHGGYTLHLAAAALQVPYANLRVILQTRIAGVDDKAGMGADATLGIGTSTMPLDLGGAARWHGIDLSNRCTAGSHCDIPIQLDVVAGPPSPPYIPGVSPLPSPTLGHGIDVYRWSVRIIVQSFDGRQLPAASAWITPAQQ